MSDNPMKISTSYINYDKKIATLLTFLFKDEIHGFQGEVHIVIGGNSEDIYISQVKLAQKNRGQHLCKLMLTSCLKEAYKIIRLGNEEYNLAPITKEIKQQLTGEVYISTARETFEAAKKCYIDSFLEIGFILTSEFSEEYDPKGSTNENAEYISQNLQFTEDAQSKEVKDESVPHFGDQYFKKGGFFFSKKKTRKRPKKKTKGKKKKKRKSKKKKKNKINKTRKKKDRKFTDTSYPYRNITKKDAVDDFLSLREMVKKNDFNSKSVRGNRAVDYGTEKMRKQTKYRNKSHYERWQDKVAREKVIKFAKRLYTQKYKRSVDSSLRGAIELQWGSVNTMRPAAAACAYKKNKATKVLDFTAGWGARLIAAMAMDIDYTGIDANVSLKPGYDKIIKLLKPYSKSKVKMIFKKAEKVKMSKLKYDFVFTSPPYEYLEVYENMENYEKKGEKVSQPYSSSKIKIDDSEKFYDEFMIPTLKEIYKYLPKGKHICLNMPDIMYAKIKKKWKKADKKDVYSIVGRVGGPEDFKRLEKEQIFCWKKH